MISNLNEWRVNDFKSDVRLLFDIKTLQLKMVIHDDTAPEEAGGGYTDNPDHHPSHHPSDRTDNETATINDVETENENNYATNANEDPSAGGLIPRTSENVESSHSAVPGGLSPEALRSA
jgi:hypothetical protein